MANRIPRKALVLDANFKVGDYAHMIVTKDDQGWQASPLLAKAEDFKDGKLDTSKVMAFEAPAGVCVEVYETSFHYAPCRNNADGFRVAIVLPKGTNTDKPAVSDKNDEDKLLWARNKWLIAHAESSEAGAGAYVGLVGENIDISK